MSWLKNVVRPKIQALIGGPKEVPDNLWEKCPECGTMLFKRELDEQMNVCRQCGYHLKMMPSKRLEMMFDEGNYTRLPLPSVPADPLKFRDQKKYSDRLKAAKEKSESDEAIVVADGLMGGIRVTVAVFDFSFMGGSMGTAVGEGIVTASRHAVDHRTPLLVIPASGGARMQEGMLSLMQMPRTIIAAQEVKASGLPYLVLFTNPTTGGVTASFAMVGDIHIAEKGATIGFAGERVIAGTIRETLPAGFQKAEYLQDHGMVDVVVHRKELRETLIRILSLLDTKNTSGKKSSANTAVPHGYRMKGKAKSA